LQCKRDRRANVIVVEVTTADADSALYLVERIERELDIDGVDFNARRMRVRIEVERTPDTKLVELLDLLEEWLFVRGLAATNVAIDDHEYLLGAAVQPTLEVIDPQPGLRPAASWPHAWPSG
jgi:uncharacterized protein YajQ (UPF0234 family)